MPTWMPSIHAKRVTSGLLDALEESELDLEILLPFGYCVFSNTKILREMLPLPVLTALSLGSSSLICIQ